MLDTTVQSEKSKAGSTTPPSSKRNTFRTGRTIWVALLALPLLAYCVVAVLTYSIKPTPINTGDALYDKYLAWVADDLESCLGQGINTYHERYMSSIEADVDWDPFGEWEAEFENDPRFWLLRYRNSRARKNEVGYWVEDIRHLKKARSLGVADGAILLIMLLDLEYSLSYDEGFNFPGYSSSIEYKVAEDKFTRGKVDELAGEQHNQLLAELLEVAGDNSLPHYYAALFDFQRGNNDSAIAHLVDGNQAPDNSSLLGFPFDRQSSDIQSGRPLPDKAVSGTICREWLFRTFQDSEDFKRMVGALVAEASKNGDVMSLSEIHLFSCRIASLKNNGTMHIMFGFESTGIVELEFANLCGSSLTPDQANNINELAKIRVQIIATAQAGLTLSNVSYHLQMTMLPTPGWALLDVLTGGRNGGTFGMEAVHDDFVNEQTALVPIHKLFQQLESFNYNTLEFE